MKGTSGPDERRGRRNSGDEGGERHLRVRTAAHPEFVPVMRILEGALLEVDAGTLETRIAAGEVLVAVIDESVLGALVLDGSYIEAVAVRRSHRNRGVGTSLVAAAADRAGTLIADFDPHVRPFYESLGFDVEERDGRLRGRWDGPPDESGGGKELAAGGQRTAETEREGAVGGTAGEDADELRKPEE